MADLLTFQQFETTDDAEAVAAVLSEYGINSSIERDRTLLDQNIIGQQYNNYIQLRIAAADFDHARKILLESTKVNLADVPADYMLLSFTHDELMDVVAKPDEWGAYNYNVALALLQQQGEVITEDKQEALRDERKVELAKPRELSALWFLFGYGFSVLGIVARLIDSAFVLWALYGFYLLPGIIGIILGIIIRFTKRTLPDGSRIWSFSAGARAHGFYMLLLGVVALVIVITGGIYIGNPVL